MTIIRIIYSPQCPVVFPYLNQIDKLSTHYGCKFEKVNIFDYGPLIDQTYYPAEQTLLKQLSEGKRVGYFFASTFIEGEEIPGFPIPVSSIEEKICSILGVEYKRQEEHWAMPQRKRIKIDETQLSVHLTTPKYFDDECELCLSHHPLVNRDYYTCEQVQVGKEGKQAFLEKVFTREAFIGYIAHVGNEPAGMVEVVPYELARRIGFVCSGCPDSRVIICLTVRAEFQGFGIGKMLIEAVATKMKEKQWSRIEVFGTPGGKSIFESWQAIPFYKKLGFVGTGIQNTKGGELLALVNKN